MMKLKGKKFLLTDQKSEISYLSLDLNFAYSHKKFSIKQFIRLFFRIKNWDSPIVCVLENGIYHIQDGHHRFLMFKLLRRKKVKVIVWRNPNEFYLKIFLDTKNFNKPQWICFESLYMYNNETLDGLLQQMKDEWRNDNHIVG